MQFFLGTNLTPQIATASSCGANAGRRNLPRRWFAAAAAAVLFGSLGLYIASFREPEYDSKPLSHWIDLYKKNFYPDPDFIEAAEAIHHIGTNALPIAVRWLCVSDSRLKPWLNEQLEKQSFFKLRLTEAEVFNERAETVFDVLGPEAVSAIPRLEKLMDEPETAERAVPILCGLGQDSLPALERGLTNRNAKVRAITARNISGSRYWVYRPWWVRWVMNYQNYHGEPLPAVFPSDLLLRRLKDPEADVRNFAARAIGESAAFRNISPEQGVPALIEALRDPVVENRNQDVASLGCFGPSASNAVPVLLDLFQTNMDLNASSCGAILDALAAIGVEKSRIVTALTKQLADNNHEETCAWAIATLTLFGPLAKPAIPQLLKYVAEYDSMGEAALRALDYAKADHALIISALRKRLKSENVITRIRAAAELGRFGPEAKPAVSSLLEAATIPDHNVSTAVYYALQEIDPVAANLNARALVVAPPDPALLGLLIKSLADENPAMRCAAADCLGKYGSDANLAVPALRAALSDENKSVREAAEIALKSINPINPTNIVSK